MRFLEVIEKKINLDRNNIDLTLLDTKITQFTKLISDTPIDSILTDDLDGVEFSNSLMTNIRARQELMNTTLGNAETEATSIGITLSYTPEYTVIPITEIEVGDRIDYDLLFPPLCNVPLFFFKREGDRGGEFFGQTRLKKGKHRGLPLRIITFFYHIV